jgi:N-dimethylarginine dimethylaminohydrolase
MDGSMENPSHRDLRESRAPRILMCPPDHYGIEYEINPWMNKERQADHTEAVRQWRRLHDLLAGLGAEISLVAPVAGLPDLVFTANAAMVFQQRAFLSRFRHVQRQGEEEQFERWLGEFGFGVERLPEKIYFEGAGDALFCGDTLIAGYRFRSDVRGHQYIAAAIGRRVLPLELVDPYFYHLDTCFCPLAPGVALYYPGAFDEYGRQVLRRSIDELIEVHEQEAREFACNAVVVGKSVVTNIECPKMHAALAARGFSPVATPLGEFVKAGGSAKCLTLRLDGEEAARW